MDMGSRYDMPRGSYWISPGIELRPNCEMASVVARLLPTPLMAVNGRQPSFGALQTLKMPAFTERQRCHSVIVKATGESSESSSIVKSVQNIWDKSDDRVAVIGLGFTSIVAFWASTNLVTAIDKLPLIPGLFELIGLLFSSWFTYRYLLFKPGREEISQALSKSLSDILGQ